MGWLCALPAAHRYWKAVSQAHVPLTLPHANQHNQNHLFWASLILILSLSSKQPELAPNCLSYQIKTLALGKSPKLWENPSRLPTSRESYLYTNIWKGKQVRFNSNKDSNNFSFFVKVSSATNMTDGFLMNQIFQNFREAFKLKISFPDHTKTT